MSTTSPNFPGTKTPKLQLVRENPEAAAIVSKAIRSRLLTRFDVNDKSTYYSLNHTKIQSISDTQKDRLVENENILDLFPDISLAEQIIVSSILAPKDMFTENLIYKTVDTLLPSNIQTKVNDIIRSHLESYYGIMDELPKILQEALFRAGSYVSAVIPEAAIDEIINGQSYATESHRELVKELIDSKGASSNLGILGPPTSVSGITALEDFFNGNAPPINTSNFVSLSSSLEMPIIDSKDENSKLVWVKSKIFQDNVSTESFLEITDNFQLIKLPDLIKSIGQQRVKRALRNPKYSSFERRKPDGISMESFDDGAKPSKLSNREFQDLIYKNKRPENEMFTVFPNKMSQKRYSIGRPLRLRIPSEAVVPVYPPGDPSNHRGYFVLVDVDGNWISRGSIDTSGTGLAGLVSNPGQSTNLTSLMISKAHKALTENQNNTQIENMLEIYSSIVETDMLARLKNGMYGIQLEIGKDKEWDRIMLARALAGKMTRLVYLPSELVTYYAYDYHPNGMGKSYLDKVKMLTSLRAVLLFSKVMAQMKNAINVTKVDMKLDPDDPDPQKTIDIASHDIIRLRESFFPLGVNSPSDLLQWIQRAGMMFTFTGHPGLPETSFEFSTANMQHAVPDSTTTDDLRKQTFMTFGLTPEQVDEGFSAQFATTIIQQNALFAKRISLLSNQTSKHISSDVQNICINDAVILKEITQVLRDGKEGILKYLDEKSKANFKEDPEKFIHHFLDKVIENIWVDLPKPNLMSQDLKGEDFQKYSELLDKVLGSFISSEVFPSSLAGEFGSHVDEVKMFWKHYLLRKWVSDEGFIPDIAELFNRDEDGKPSNDVLDVMRHYAQDVLTSGIKFMKEMKEASTATDKDIDRLGVGEGQTFDTPAPSSSSGSEFDFGGDLDLDTDLDTGGDASGDEEPSLTPEVTAAGEAEEEEEEPGTGTKDTPI